MYKSLDPIKIFLIIAVGVVTGVSRPCEGQDKSPGQESNENSVDESIVLFDGKNLDQWRGYKQEEIGQGWQVENGAIHFTGTNGGDIITKMTFTNFDLSFEWKVSKAANSGVMYFVTLGDGAPYLSGPEYQILDDGGHDDGKNGLTSAGSLYALYAPEKGETKKIGEWNSARIVINGDTIQHWLNGTKVVEADLESDDWKKRLEASKFKDWEKFAASRSGHVCLQDHGNEVWFRNITLTPLKSKKTDR